MKLANLALLLPVGSGFTDFDVAPSVGSLTAFDEVRISYDPPTERTESCAGCVTKTAGASNEAFIGNASEDKMQRANPRIMRVPTGYLVSDIERSGTSWNQWLNDALPKLLLGVALGLLLQRGRPTQRMFREGRMQGLWHYDLNRRLRTPSLQGGGRWEVRRLHVRRGQPGRPFRGTCQDMDRRTQLICIRSDTATTTV